MPDLRALLHRRAILDERQRIITHINAERFELLHRLMQGTFSDDSANLVSGQELGLSLIAEWLAEEPQS